MWSGLGGFVIGIGLSAAFLPFLGLSIAAMNNFIQLAPEFQWIATWPSFIAFATATILEITAYYVPWLDNVLDAATTPLAVVAGTIATATVVDCFECRGRNGRHHSDGHVASERYVHRFHRWCREFRNFHG